MLFSAQGMAEQNTVPRKTYLMPFLVNRRNGAMNSMTTISKSGTGIQSPVDQVDYTQCKICCALVTNRRARKPCGNSPRCRAGSTGWEWNRIMTFKTYHNWFTNNNDPKEYEDKLEKYRCNFCGVYDDN